MLKFKQKNTPEFLTGQAKIRQNLIKSLSRAIKEVQLQFAHQDPQTKGAGAIGDCVGSQHVCNAFEEVLKHGLKPSWFGKGPSTFWPIVQKISRKQAVEYIGSLQHAQSDSAKCRGWIRMAVNECSLESYINVICQDTSLLAYYYEEYSFLRDPETVSALTQLLTGLSLITFKLTVDVRSLEFDSVPEVHSDVPLRMKPELIARSTASGNKRSKKVKEKEANAEADNCSTASSSCVSLDSIPAALDSTQASSNSIPSIPDSTPGFISDPNSTLTGLNSTPAGPDSTPASDNVSLDPQYNGTLERDPPQDSSDIGTKGSDDGVWTDSDLLGPDGGFKYEEEGEGLEGAWHGSGEEGSVNVSFDSSDVGLGQEVEGGEWQVDSTLTSHMIDHMTGAAAEEEVGGQTGGYTLDSGYQRLLEDGVGTSGHVSGQKHTGGDLQDTGGGDLQDTLTGTQNLQDAIDIGLDLQDTPGMQHDLQDTAYHLQDTGSNLQDTSYDLQDRQQRHDTLVAEDQQAVALATSFNPFSPTPPLSPTNPFLSPTPPDASGAMPTARGDSSGPNPFLSSSQHSNPFQQSPIPAARPLNPFSSNSAHSSPPTCSMNPFDIDDHAHTEAISHPPPSCPSPIPAAEDAPPTLPSPSLSDEQDYPGGGEEEDKDDLHAATLPDFLLPSVPLHAPQTRQNPPTPSPGPSPEPRKASRPGSASTTRSRMTDDLESYSSSSIDISMLMETTPSGLDSHAQLNSPEENFFASEMSSVEMQLAIDRLKVELAKSALDEGPDKNEMRHKVVELQMRLRKRRDEEEEMDQLTTSVGKEICGHRFFKQSRQTPVGRRRVCEGCGKKIRGLVHSWYLCKLCGFGCHSKCLSIVDRVCSGSTKKPAEDEQTPSFILEVCPEKGLTDQLFRCASCNIAFNSTTVIARQCDYSGQYYCPACHHNDLAVIPARVVHNWDFSPRKVCCKCCDLLDRQATKPLLKVRAINPLLYTYVQELVTIESLRKDLLVMKMYFVHCPNAMELQLLKRLDPFPHFKDGAKRFSLLDLQAVYRGDLLKQLTVIHSEFAAHIKRNCTICSGKGFSCELCHATETLYPFDRRCRQCPKCRSIYHK